MSDQGKPVGISHLIVDASLFWVIGRNVTANANINHIVGNYLQFRWPGTNEVNILTLTEHDIPGYLRREQFYHEDYPSVHDSTSASLCVSTINLTWNQTTQIVDPVHEHVCSHAK